MDSTAGRGQMCTVHVIETGIWGLSMIFTWLLGTSLLELVSETYVIDTDQATVGGIVLSI